MHYVSPDNQTDQIVIIMEADFERTPDTEELKISQSLSKITALESLCRNSQHNGVRSRRLAKMLSDQSFHEYSQSPGLFELGQ